MNRLSRTSITRRLAKLEAVAPPPRPSPIDWKTLITASLAELANEQQIEAAREFLGEYDPETALSEIAAFIADHNALANASNLPRATT